MEIITNCSTENTNHYNLLRDLLLQHDSALFVSPYLYKEFDLFFKDINLKDKSLELITSCAPKGLEQLNKPNSMKNFAKYILQKSGVWPKIHLNQKLHSKVYIFSNSNTPKVGVITSANLTRSGMAINNETGVIIQDHTALEHLMETLKQECKYVDIDKTQLMRLCAEADAQNQKQGKAKNIDIDIGLDEVLNDHFTPSDTNLDIKIRPNAKFFIKVSGVSNKPILPIDKKTFGEKNRRLSFAKKPNSIAIGDCLIEVAIGGKCFLSYHSCTSRILEYTDSEKSVNKDYLRWKYYTNSNNLSQTYGYNWFTQPLYYHDVIEDFKSANPNTAVTASGKDHIVGAISSGNSYFQITPEFGKYVIDLIDKIKF